MSGPARTGVLFYANDLATVSTFYERILDARVVHADETHRILQSPNVQLIIHAIPQPYAAQIHITAPPVPREEQAIKPFFTVVDLAISEVLVVQSGGVILGPIWDGPGIRVRNVCDPDGNIIQLREPTPSTTSDGDIPTGVR